MINLGLAVFVTVSLMLIVFCELAFGEMQDEWEWQDRRIDSIERRRQQQQDTP